MRVYAPSLTLKFLGFAFAGYIILHIANIFVLAHGFCRKLTLISTIYFFALTVTSVFFFYLEYDNFYADSYGSIIGENLVYMLQIALFVTSYYMHPTSGELNPIAGKKIPVEPAKAPILKLINVWSRRALVVELKSNGEVLGTYTIEKNKLSEDISVPALNVTINVKGHYEIPLKLGEGSKYVCEIHRMQLKQYNDMGLLLRSYGFSTGMAFLCFFIPVVGYVIGAVRWEKFPMKAKAAMRYALLGSIFTVLYNVMFSLENIVQ